MDRREIRTDGTTGTHKSHLAHKASRARRLGEGGSHPGPIQRAPKRTVTYRSNANSPASSDQCGVEIPAPQTPGVSLATKNTTLLSIGYSRISDNASVK